MRAKTVLTDVGPVVVKVPQDVTGTIEPAIVKKRQRSLTWVDEMVRRDLRAPGRGLRRERVQDDHLHDHRQ